MGASKPPSTLYRALQHWRASCWNSLGALECLSLGCCHDACTCDVASQPALYLVRRGTRFLLSKSVVKADSWKQFHPEGPKKTSPRPRTEITALAFPTQTDFAISMQCGRVYSCLKTRMLEVYHTCGHIFISWHNTARSNNCNYSTSNDLHVRCTLIAHGRVCINIILFWCYIDPLRMASVQVP